MPQFQAPVHIGNRALQHCGVDLMDESLGFTENSKNALEVSKCYAQLRAAELERNNWRFAIKKVALRGIDSNTMLVAPALWESSTSYFVGSLVSDSQNNIWQSQIPTNSGNDPQNSTAWEQYFGPLTAALYDGTLSYFAGEIVYTAAGDGTYNVYASLIEGNTLDPSLPNQWSPATTYFKGDVVQTFPPWSSATTYTPGQTVLYTDGNIYTSLVTGNLNNIPPSNSTKWALVPVITLASLTVPVVNSSPPIPSFTTPVGEWNQGTTYTLGNVVMFNTVEYVSIAASNTGNFPNAPASTFWAAMTGGTSFMSLIDLNIGNVPSNSPAPWASGTSYAINTIVAGSDGNQYKSLVGSNLGNNPVGDGGVHWQNLNILVPWTSTFTGGGGNQQWLQIGGAAFPAGVALSELNVIYPVGAGPTTQDRTRNLFRLPANYMRQAPRDPKAGSTSWLGAPSGLAYNDWNFESDYITSYDVRPIILRFIGDVTDVRRMNAMFCEGLAYRIAITVAPPLTQSSAKLVEIEKGYQVFMSDGRMVNGIETGSDEPPEDDYIVCRR